MYRAWMLAGVTLGKEGTNPVAFAARKLGEGSGFGSSV